MTFTVKEIIIFKIQNNFTQVKFLVFVVSYWLFVICKTFDNNCDAAEMLTFLIG